jgi:uncharacterized protein involved in outer membrane biogenesis
MKKLVLAAVLFLAISFGFAIYYVLSSLDGMVKTAIETYGSQATETTVLVDSVQIVLKDGSGAIRGLTVGNPQGFAAPQAFSLGQVATQVDLKSLSEEVTVIEHIIVQAPVVFFELNEAGKTNLGVLKQNLSSASSGTSASSSANRDSGAEPKFIIRKLLFTDGNIHARAVALNQDYELKLPRIEMSNLGGKNGATPKQIAEQVLKTLTDRSLAEVQKQGIDQYKAQLEDKINQQLEAEKEQINDTLKGVLNY